MPHYKFSDLAYNINDKKMPEPGDEKTYIGLEHLDSGSLAVTRWGSEVELKGQKLVMKKGDILFGRRNTYLRRAAIAPHDGIFSAHGMIFRPKTEVIDPDYFPFFIASDYFMNAAIKISVGSLSPTVNWKTLKELKFEIPTLEQQRESAKILKAANELKESYQALLLKTDDLVKSQFIDMFGDLNTNEKGYKKEPLKNHADIMVGYPFKSKEYTETGIKIVGGYNLMQGYIDWEISKFFPSPSGYEQYLLKGNDIIMAMDRPWVGDGFKIAVVDAANLPALLIQRTACIRTIDIEREFLYVMLNSEWFAEHCDIKGSLVPHISNKDINSFEIFVPPIEEQIRFSEFVHQSDKSKFELKQAIEGIDVLIKSLIQQELN